MMLPALLLVFGCSLVGCDEHNASTHTWIVPNQTTKQRVLDAISNLYPQISGTAGKPHLTEFIRAFTYSLAAAEKVKNECNDSSVYDDLFPARPWNEAFYDESDKIVEDILKDWTPPR